jgi:hypothetical protein
VRVVPVTDYQFIHSWYDSYGPRKGTRALFVHFTEGAGGWPDVYYLADGAARTAAGYSRGDGPARGVSVNFVILGAAAGKDDGRIVRMLGWDRASGSINPNSLRRDNDPTFTAPDGSRVTYGYGVSKAVLGDGWSDPNAWGLSVELAGKAANGPSAKQSESLAALMAEVRVRYGATVGALAHRDEQNYKPCPGHRVLWASLGGHGKPVFAPPPQAPEDPMGVSIKLGSTAGDPLASFGIATLKGAGHELISVATSAVVGKDMPDGYPLGLVEKGTLAKATSWGTAGEAVVTYNVDGAQAVSPLRDVTFVPLSPPPGVTPVAKVQTLDSSGKVLNEFRPVTA